MSVLIVVRQTSKSIAHQQVKMEFRLRRKTTSQGEEEKFSPKKKKKEEKFAIGEKIL